jgi:DNA-binding NarL/FixJ family response regulator
MVTTLKKIRVIVTDDDHDVVNTISTLLEEKGIRVIGKAYDGEDASEQYFLHKPDVLLLDLEMENYDGHYAIEKIKQEDPNAKIIVISSYLDWNFQANKVSAVFSKPVDIDELVDKIKKIANS